MAKRTEKKTKAKNSSEPARSRSLKLTAFYPHSPEEVWKALTDQGELAQWFMKGEFEARVGAKVRWSNADSSSRIQGLSAEVQIVESPKTLSFRVDGPGEGQVSLVTWTLEARGDGTHVELEQKWIEADEIKPHPKVVSLALYRREKMSREWLALLVALLSDRLVWRAVA